MSQTATSTTSLPKEDLCEDKASISATESSLLEPRSWWKTAVDEVLWLFTTREGLIGDYDYVYLLTPDIPPFNRKYKNRIQPFFGIDDRIPLLLTVLLGIQHALAMIGGIVAPPLLVAGSGGANLSSANLSYLVSSSLILAGVFSFFQIVRFRIGNTGLWIGTGMLSVVGEAFSIVPVAFSYFTNEYNAGRCPTGPDNERLPCPEGYGRFLGTMACVMLVQVALSLVKPRILMKIFPKLVTGMVLVCIGASLVTSGMEGWAGGSGTCMSRPATGLYSACPDTNAPKPLPWGHPSFIGLGFSVFITTIIVEVFGSPLLRNCSVAVGLVIGAIIASATGYIDNSSITAAPKGTFLWTTTFPLGVDGSLVLPLIAACIINLVSCLGDAIATAEVSGLDVDSESGAGVDDRVQGGLTADGIWSVLAPLCTTTPTTIFAQNNGVISLTNCASRRAGYACCVFLFVAGVASRFGAAIVALPSSVIGGMTTFLFTSIVVSGFRILSGVKWNRRNRFIATAAMAIGLSDLLVPHWTLYLIPEGGSSGLQGLKDGVSLILGTSYCIVAFIGVALNILMPDKEEEPRDRGMLPRVRED